MLVRGFDIVDNDAMAAITRKRKKRLQWMKIDSDLKLLSASPVTKFMTSLTVLFRSSRADETASRELGLDSSIVILQERQSCLG